MPENLADFAAAGRNASNAMRPAGGLVSPRHPDPAVVAPVSGSDGSAVLDGDSEVSWAVRDGGVYRVVRNPHLVDLTVAEGVTLLTDGHHLQVDGELVVDGAVDDLSAIAHPAGSPAEDNPSWPLAVDG